MDDRDLIEAYAQDGSERAIAELTRRYEGLILGLCQRSIEGG